MKPRSKRTHKASRNQRNLQKVIVINQRLIRWLEGKISEGLESLGKEADQRAVDWVIGAKNSLLATLVTLSNVSIALEKSPVCDEPNVTEAQDVPFSEADVTLVRSFLSKHSNA